MAISALAVVGTQRGRGTEGSEQWLTARCAGLSSVGARARVLRGVVVVRVVLCPTWGHQATRIDDSAPRLGLCRPMGGGLRWSSQQQLVHLLSRCLPAERLSWAAVELCGDVVEVGLGVDGEVGALGQVLAQ